MMQDKAVAVASLPASTKSDKWVASCISETSSGSLFSKIRVMKSWSSILKPLGKRRTRGESVTTQDFGPDYSMLRRQSSPALLVLIRYASLLMPLHSVLD